MTKRGPPYKAGHPDAQDALEVWYRIVEGSEWSKPNEVKITFGNASIIANDRVVFNICSNKYRLVVQIDYRKRRLFVKFIGTHKRYDEIEAATVSMTSKKK